MAELLVFDLQRFALHDGPGIRTTVFLKGCPLDCLWCHNPESKQKNPQLGFLEKKCTGCGRCVKICDKGVHRIAEDGSHEIDFSLCSGCGRCVKGCINQALKVFGMRMTSDDILKTVMRDADFYQRSGGGLTVSGGEPMLQFDGLMELLKGAKERGLHVCLDTCGQAPGERYLEAAKYVDLFLFDYKITDPEDHRTYTGVDNRLIKGNLELLCENGSNIFLRCPIIPGINDTSEHYRAISGLSRKYDQIRQVNLMTYHDMAKGKAAQIGEKYALADKKTVEAEQKRQIYDEVRSFGCLRLEEG